MIPATLFADAFTDVYDVRFRLRVPRVYDNGASLGYRKYQTQDIRGQMFVTYGEDALPSVSFSDFTNLTHLIGDSNVTYTASLDEDALMNFSWCGDNRKQTFTRPNCNFAVVLSPSYKRGDDMLDDLHLTVACTVGSSLRTMTEAGRVQIAKTLTGYAAGQLRCNCTAWGHVSPTRIWGLLGPTYFVTDIASVAGSVRMRYNKKESRK